MAGALGAYVPQTLIYRPEIHSSVEIDGVSYLLCGRNENFQNTIIEVLPDGYWQQWPLWAPGEWQAKAYCVYGTRIYMPMNYDTGNLVTIGVFETTTKRATSFEVLNTGVSGAQYGTGCIGPDGLIYFPPWRSPSGFANLKPLVIDPATNTGTGTDFGGSWVMNEHSGTFTVGGGGGSDSNRMYFTPGQVTALGGSYSSGLRIGYITFPAKTVTYLTIPDDPIFENPENTFLWAYPRAAGGIYTLSFSDGWYTVTPAGVEFLGTHYIYSDYYDNYGELTESPEFDAPPFLGDDGLLYVLGSGYAQAGSYPPVIAFIDPATEEVHFQEFYNLGAYGRSWLPSVTWRHGAGMRTAPVKGGRSPWNEIFQNTLNGVASSTPQVSYRLGATTVSLALGAIPIETLWLGAGAPTPSVPEWPRLAGKAAIVSAATGDATLPVVTYETAVLADSPIWYFPLNDGSAPPDDQMNFATSPTAWGTFAWGQPGIGDRATAVVESGASRLDTNMTTPSGLVNFSAECLVKPNAIGSYQNVMTQDGFARVYILRITPAGKVEVIIFDSSGNPYFAVGTTTLVAGSSYHIAFTHTPFTTRVYVNGVLDNAATMTTTTVQTNPGTVSHNIGGDDNATFPFAGTLAGAAIFTTTLSAARILAHAQAAGLG